MGRVPPSPPFSHNLSFSELFSSRNVEFATHNAGILQGAMISALKNKQIAAAAIEVLDIEPLPASHPFRTLDNVLATPHIGYVSHGHYKTFYEDTVSNIRKWLDTAQMRGSG